MLGEHDIPDCVKASPEVLQGDVELFMKSFELGEQYHYWQQFVARSAVSDDEKVRCFITSLNYAAPPPTTPSM